MIMGDLVIGWKLLQAAGIAREKLDALYREAGTDDAKAHNLARNSSEIAFYLGKVASAKYFAANILPTVHGKMQMHCAGR